MNVFELVIASAKTYFSKIWAYSLAGAGLMAASAIVLGWFSAVLIMDGAIALTAGDEYGVWAKSVPHIAAMVFWTVTGMCAVFFLAFSVWGGFLNLCDKIGSGAREAGLAEFAGYGLSRWKTFHAIGMLQVSVGIVFSIPGIAAMFFHPLIGIALVIAGQSAAAAIFYFAYAAAVVEGCGALQAIGKSFRAAFYKPLATIVAYALCAAVVLIGLPLVPLYPVYYFIAASPVIAIVQLEYYRRVAEGEKGKPTLQEESSAASEQAYSQPARGRQASAGAGKK